MNFPIWITNFKNYPSAVAENTITLAMAHEEVRTATGKSLAIAVNAINLESAANIVNVPVFAQHVDPIDYGSRTGHIHPEVVKNAGAQATLLNHSERRLDPAVIEATIAKCKEYGLPVIVCAESPEEVKQFAEFKPTALAYEPPELIGSSDCSVASKPDCIRDAVAFAGNIPLLVGAGISKPADVEVSLKLGAQGFW